MQKCQIIIALEYICQTTKFKCSKDQELNVFHRTASGHHSNWIIPEREQIDSNLSCKLAYTKYRVNMTSIVLRVSLLSLMFLNLQTFGEASDFCFDGSNEGKFWKCTICHLPYRWKKPSVLSIGSVGISLLDYNNQGRRKIDNWGAYIHIFVFYLIIVPFLADNFIKYKTKQTPKIIIL